MKNYTSTVDPLKSISQIEAMLVKAGARNIAKDYDGAKVKSISFTIKHPEADSLIVIRLPANVQAMYEFFRKGVKRWSQRGMQNRLQDQAERTAWRIMHDWVAVQLSLIELRQVELLQVFLPYVWDGKQSYFEYLRTSKFAALTAAPAIPAIAEGEDDHE